MTTADFYGSQLPVNEPISNKKDIELGFCRMGGEYAFRLVIDKEEYDLILNHDDILNFYLYLTETDPVKKEQELKLQRTIELNSSGSNYE